MDVVEFLAVADGVDLVALLHGVIKLAVRCEADGKYDRVGGDRLLGAGIEITDDEPVLRRLHRGGAAADVRAVERNEPFEHFAVGRANGGIHGEQLRQRLDDRDLFAEILREPERQLAADHAAADDDRVLADILAALRKRVLRGDDMAVVAQRECFRFRAGGDDKRIEFERFQLFGSERMVEVDLHAELFERMGIPRDQSAVVVLEGRDAGFVQRASQTAGGFVNDRLVAADGEHAGGLAAGNAAADDDDLLFAEHRIIGKGALAGALGVDGAVDHGVALDAAHAALLTADAGADVRGLSGAELVHIVGVGEQRTAERDDIADAGSHGFNGHIRIVHPPGAEHRHVHDLLYRFGVFAVKTLFLIHGRMAPPPGVVGADVHVERVVAVGYEQFRRFQTLFHVAALFDELFTGQRALAPVLDHALRGEAQRHGEIRAAGLLYLLDDLAGKAQPVFQTAAVFVRALVEEADGELVDEIALVHRVDLHAVKSGALGVVGALAEALHDGVDLVHGQRPAGLVQPAVGDRRGSDRRELAEICRDRDAAETAGHLQKDLAAVGVDSLGHLPACPDKMHGVVCAVRAVGHGLHFHRAVGKRDARDDEARAALGALGVVINAALVKAALRVRQSERAHRGHGKSVF